MDQLHALIERAKKEIGQETLTKKRNTTSKEKNIIQNPLLFNLAEIAKSDIHAEKQIDIAEQKKKIKEVNYRIGGLKHSKLFRKGLGYRQLNMFMQKRKEHEDLIKKQQEYEDFIKKQQEPKKYAGVSQKRKQEMKKRLKNNISKCKSINWEKIENYIES